MEEGERQREKHTAVASPPTCLHGYPWDFYKTSEKSWVTHSWLHSVIACFKLFNWQLTTCTKICRFERLISKTFWVQSHPAPILGRGAWAPSRLPRPEPHTPRAVKLLASPLTYRDHFWLIYKPQLYKYARPFGLEFRPFKISKKRVLLLEKELIRKLMLSCMHCLFLNTSRFMGLLAASAHDIIDMSIHQENVYWWCWMLVMWIIAKKCLISGEWEATCRVYDIDRISIAALQLRRAQTPQLPGLLDRERKRVEITYRTVFIVEVTY